MIVREVYRCESKNDFPEKISGEKFEKLFVFAEGVMYDYFDCL
jgi:hypothetical protein